MRVMQITAFSGWGCTGRIALGIHNALKAENHESLIAWGRRNTVPEEIETIKIGSKIDQQIHGLYTRFTDKCGFASKRVTRTFLKKIEEYKPDLIQLHILHGYYINLEILFNYIKKHNIPIVWTFHDCWAFTGHCPYFDLIGCEKWKTGCNNCPQKAHHPTSWLMDNSVWNWKKKKELFTKQKMTVVTPSKWLGGLVKQSFLKECNVHVINNGINLVDFKPTQSDIARRMDIESKKIVLGVSSTWVKSKGLDDFIQLSKILPSEYQIVLVGLSKKQIKELPPPIIGVERTDSIRELAELYTAATVFVNPTYEDNYPTTNLEAIACGTPVVTYKTGGSTEVVEKTGNGEIVDQGNIVGLKDAIIRLEGHILADIDLHKVCSQEYAFEQYVSLYHHILKGEV